MHFVHFGSREAMRDPRLRLIARRAPEDTLGAGFRPAVSPIL